MFLSKSNPMSNTTDRPAVREILTDAIRFAADVSAARYFSERAGEHAGLAFTGTLRPL